MEVKKTKSELKDESRDARFIMSESTRYEREDYEAYAKLATRHCKMEAETFTACSKTKSISLLWSCQEEFKALNKCTEKYESEHPYEKYRKARDEERIAKRDAAILAKIADKKV